MSRGPNWNKVDVSYCICVGPPENFEYLRKLLYTIIDQDHLDNNYEIILCGGNIDFPTLKSWKIDGPRIVIIPFGEEGKPWITRKKNLMAAAARYDNLVILHDYYMLDDEWYYGLVHYTNRNPKWELLINPTLTFEGAKHSDWLVDQKYMDIMLDQNPDIAKELKDIAPNENGPRWVCGLPYEETDLKHIQYISGGAIIAKRYVLMDNPLDENLRWGDAEDLEWSSRVIPKYKLFLNRNSLLSVQKPNKWHVYEMNKNAVSKLKGLFPDEL